MMTKEDLQRELDEAKRVLEIASRNLTAAKRSYDEALRAFLLGRKDGYDPKKARKAKNENDIL